MGFRQQELEYGPGLFAPYFVKDKEESVEELLGEFGRLLDNLTFGGNVILEMGRYLYLSVWLLYYFYRGYEGESWSDIMLLWMAVSII